MATDGRDRQVGAPRPDAPRADDSRFEHPGFDVVLRGYDRRQVDQHLVKLTRVLARMRNELEAARGAPPVPPSAPLPPAGRPRPGPRPRADGPPSDRTGPDRNGPDVVGTFTERMQAILQAAEEEAAEIRAKARGAAAAARRTEEERLSALRASVKAEEERLAGLRAAAQASIRAEEERLAKLRTAAKTSAQAAACAEEETARAAVVNLIRQRDAVLADLTRMRGQLEALLSAPTTRFALPEQDEASAAARRDAGAGHPLPGTPTPPSAGVDPPGAGAGGAGRKERTDRSTTTASASTGAAVSATPAERRPGAGEGTTATAAGAASGEQTVAVAPARGRGAGRGAAPVDHDVPLFEDPGTAGPPAVDATVQVGAVGRPVPQEAGPARTSGTAPRPDAAPASGAGASTAEERRTRGGRSPDDATTKGDPEPPRPERAPASTSR